MIHAMQECTYTPAEGEEVCPVSRPKWGPSGLLHPEQEIMGCGAGVACPCDYSKQ